MTPLNRKALTLGAVLVAVTGCAPQTTPVGQASPAAQPSVTRATSAAADAACPVDAATLEKAFKANHDLASAILLGGGLNRITCYQGYAVAHTTPTNVDPALVLFVYDRTTQTWTAVTGGTAVPCGKDVPAAVVPHLPGCADQ